MFEANQYRIELSERFQVVGRAYAAAEAGYSALRKEMYIKDYLPSPMAVIEAALCDWLEAKRKVISDTFDAGTGARIPIEILPAKYRSPHELAGRNVHEIVSGHMSIESAGDIIVSVYDFAGLAAFVQKHARELASAGYASTANTLANELGLNSMNRRAAVPVLKAGRYAFTVSVSPSGYSGNYYLSDIATFKHLAGAMALMEREMGVTGGSEALHEIYEAFEANTRGFESRTAICKGKAIWATVFNNKVVLSFSPVLADALLAFVAINATVPIVGAAVKQTA